VARTREFDTEAALERAMEVFRARGYEAATTRELAAAMGIGAGSLYAAFGNKESLYVAALQLHREQAAALTERHLSVTSDPREIIRFLLRQACARSAPAPIGPDCLLTSAAIERAGRDPRVDRLMRDATAALEESFAEMLRAARERGQLAPGSDIVALARFLITTMQGLRVMARTDPDALESVVEVAVSCLR
jgi:TetR/AcrR family transcriptional repressor of nem operon